MSNKFPCVLCNTDVKSNHEALLCTSCNDWVHISCASVPVEMYNDVSELFLNWKCPKCIMRMLPFYDENTIVSSSTVHVSNSIEDIPNDNQHVQSDSSCKYKQ